MPLQARIGADFGEFKRALQDIKGTFNDFSSSTTKLQNDLNRLTRSFGGDTIRREAELMAKAIGDIGGASKLTVAEQKRVNVVMTEALAKYRALGQEAPPHLRAIAAATQTVETKTSGLGAAIGNLRMVFGALGIAFGAHQLISFGRDLLQTADEIQKMADRTSMATEEIQKLQYIGGQTSVSLDGLVGAAQNLQQRLGSGDKGLGRAVKDLGLNLATLKTETPYEQLIDLGAAIGDVKNPTDQARIAAAIFGKTWKEIMPAIRSDMKKLADEAPYMSDAAVKAWDRMGDALARYQGKLKSVVAESFVFIQKYASLGASTIGDIMWGGGAGSTLFGGPVEWALKNYGPQPGKPQPGPSLPPGGGSDWGDQIQKRQEQLYGAAAQEDAAKWAASVKSIGDITRFTREQQDTLNKAMREGIAAAEAFGKVVPAKWRDIEQATLPVLASAREFAGMGRLFEGIEKPAIELTNLLEGLTADGMLPLNASFAGMQDLVEGVTPAIGNWRKQLADAAETADKELDASLRNLAQSFSYLSQVADGALGDLVRGLGTLITAAQTAKDSIDSINKGKAAGGLTGWLGMASGIGGLVGTGLAIGKTIAGWFGPGKEYKETVSTRAQFEASIGGVDQLIKKVSDAYATLGRSGAEAQTALKRFWDAKTQTEYQSALNALTQAMEDAAEKTEDMAEAARKATEEEAKHSPAGMQSIAERYGFTGDVLTKGMGSTFWQGILGAESKTVMQDLDQLIKGGANRDWMLQGMGGAVSSIVQRALAADAAIPGYLREMVDTLSSWGQLIDENGNKIDASGLKYDELAKWQDAQVTALDENTQALNDLTDAVGSLTFPIGERYPMETAELAHWGGWVTPTGIKRFHTGGLASDEVPAILQAGELVISRNRAAGVLDALRANGAQRPIEITVISQLDGERLARVLARVQPGVTDVYVRGN